MLRLPKASMTPFLRWYVSRTTGYINESWVSTSLSPSIIVRHLKYPFWLLIANEIYNDSTVKNKLAALHIVIVRFGSH